MNNHTQQIGTLTYHCDESGLVQPIASPDVVLNWRAQRQDGAELAVKAANYEEAVRLVEEAWGEVYFVVALEEAL